MGQELITMIPRPEYADNIKQQQDTITKIEKTIEKIKKLNLTPKQVEIMKGKMKENFADDIEDFKLALESRKELLEFTQCVAGREELMAGLLQTLQNIDSIVRELLLVGYEMPIPTIREKDFFSTTRWPRTEQEWHYNVPEQLKSFGEGKKSDGPWPEWKGEKREEVVYKTIRKVMRWDDPENNVLEFEDDEAVEKHDPPNTTVNSEDEEEVYTPGSDYERDEDDGETSEYDPPNSTASSEDEEEIHTPSSETNTVEQEEDNGETSERDPPNSDAESSEIESLKPLLSRYDEDGLDYSFDLNWSDDEHEDVHEPELTRAIYRPNRLPEPVNPELYWAQWRHVKPEDEVHQRFFEVEDNRISVFVRDHLALEGYILRLTVIKPDTEETMEPDIYDYDDLLSPLDIAAQGMRETAQFRQLRRQAKEREDDKWVDEMSDSSSESATSVF